MEHLYSFWNNVYLHFLMTELVLLMKGVLLETRFKIFLENDGANPYFDGLLVSALRESAMLILHRSQLYTLK